MDSERLKEIFSKNLLYWLAYRGKTQADLYKMAGVSSATASDWCNGKKIPRTDKLVDIAQWLMIELSDLLYESNRERVDTDSIIYRLKDDIEFKNVIADINNFDPNQFQRVKDYIELLKK